MDGLQKLTPGRLELEVLAGWLAAPPLRLTLDPDAHGRIDAAAALVAKAAAGEAPVYGVNTGFGKLARVRIAPADIADLQRRLVLSHMCGVGAPLDDATVRLVLLLKAASLGLGRSGVRPKTIDALLRLLAARRPAGHPGSGVGRRLGRSGATGPCRGSADRRGADPARRPATARPPRPWPRSADAADAGRQGRPGAAQRHAGVDGPGDRRPAQGRRLFDAALSPVR